MKQEKVLYMLGSSTIRGFAIASSEGLHWFNTTKRLTKGKGAILVPASDLKFQEIGKEVENGKERIF